MVLKKNCYKKHNDPKLKTEKKGIETTSNRHNDLVTGFEFIGIKKGIIYSACKWCQDISPKVRFRKRQFISYINIYRFRISNVVSVQFIFLFRFELILF